MLIVTQCKQCSKSVKWLFDLFYLFNLNVLYLLCCRHREQRENPAMPLPRPTVLRYAWDALGAGGRVCWAPPHPTTAAPWPGP